MSSASTTAKTGPAALLFGLAILVAGLALPPANARAETVDEVVGRLVAEAETANLELVGAEAGVAMASGMGAISSVLWSFLQAGDEIITDKTLYGCTFPFFSTACRALA